METCLSRTGESNEPYVFMDSEWKEFNFNVFHVWFMPVSFSSPGKIILFGEHAVVFGEAAIAAAINLRTRAVVTEYRENRFNGFPLRKDMHAYPYHSFSLTGATGKSASVESSIPPGGGMGSSAALSTSLVAALNNDGNEARTASIAFNVELGAQGRASPLDTSTSAHGYGVFISSSRVSSEIWSISSGTVTWHIGHVDVGRMTVVAGYTGSGAATGHMVDKVRRLWEKYPTARDAVSEIGGISQDAMKALRGGDMVALGRLMDRNQRLLSVLGVSTKELDQLIDAVRPFSYGAKLTGAGGGGCIIALTDRPEKAGEAIAARGGVPIICRTGEEGLRRETPEG